MHTRGVVALANSGRGGERRRSVADLYPIKSVEQLIRDNPQPNEPVIEGLLRRQEIGAFVGATKLHKSWAMLDLAIAAVSGRPWLDAFPVRGGSCLIVDFECHDATLADRIKILCAAKGIDAAQLPNLQTMTLRGRKYDRSSIISRLKNLNEKPWLAVLDPMYRFAHGIDENSNSSMAGVFLELDEIAAAGPAVMIPHHCSKGLQNRKRTTDVGSGAGAIGRSVDTLLVLREHQQADCAVLDGVVRSFPPITPRVLKWQGSFWTLDGNLSVNDLLGDDGNGRRRDDDADVTSIVTAISSGCRTKAEIQAKTGLKDKKLGKTLNRAWDSGKITKEDRSGLATLYGLPA